MSTDRTSPPPADLAAQLAQVTAELAALRSEVRNLAQREIAVAAIYQSGQDAGSLHFSRQVMRHGIALGRELERGETAARRPASRRDRHGLRLASAGES